MRYQRILLTGTITDGVYHINNVVLAGYHIRVRSILLYYIITTLPQVSRCRGIQSIDARITNDATSVGSRCLKSRGGGGGNTNTFDLCIFRIAVDNSKTPLGARKQFRLTGVFELSILGRVLNSHRYNSGIYIIGIAIII